MGVRLVATDRDGTALRQGLSLSPRVTEAIAAAREAGIVVVFVTARNWRSVSVIAESAGVGGMAICSNGAVLYNLDDQVVVAAHPVDHRKLMEFMSRCREAEPQVAFAWETAHEAFSEESGEVGQRGQLKVQVWSKARRVIRRGHHPLSLLSPRRPSTWSGPWVLANRSSEPIHDTGERHVRAYGRRATWRHLASNRFGWSRSTSESDADRLHLTPIDGRRLHPAADRERVPGI